MKRLKGLLMLLVGWLLAGCAPGGDQATPTTAASGENVLAGTSWTLVSYGPLAQETPAAPGAAATLQFNADGTAGGSGGCNSYGGDYQLQGDTLTFDQIVSTLMACEDAGIMDQEQAFLAALQSAGRFELAGDGLTIWYGGDQGVLRFTAA